MPRVSPAAKGHQQCPRIRGKPPKAEGWGARIDNIRWALRDHVLLEVGDIKNGPCFIKLVCVSTPSRSKNILRAVLEAMELQGVDGARMLVKGPASRSCRTHFFLSGVKLGRNPEMLEKCCSSSHRPKKHTQTLMTNPDVCDVNKPRCSEAKLMLRTHMKRSGVSKEIERAIIYPMGIIAYLLPLRTRNPQGHVTRSSRRRPDLQREDGIWRLAVAGGIQR